MRRMGFVVTARCCKCGSSAGGMEAARKIEENYLKINDRSTLSYPASILINIAQFTTGKAIICSTYRCQLLRISQMVKFPSGCIGNSSKAWQCVRRYLNNIIIG